MQAKIVCPPSHLQGWRGKYCKLHRRDAWRHGEGVQRGGAGKGSEFVVRLPRSAVAAPEPVQPAADLAAIVDIGLPELDGYQGLLGPVIRGWDCLAKREFSSLLRGRSVKWRKRWT